MEIVWNKNINKVPFEVVDIGHTFTYNDEIFMKINNVSDKEDNIVNTVNIRNGLVATFYDDEYVTPIEGKFVVD